MFLTSPSIVEPTGCASKKGVPRVRHALLQPEADAALVLVDIKDDDFHLLAGGDDLAGMNVLLRPAHLGDVDQAFDARLQFDEGAVVGNISDTTEELGADRILQLDAFPRVGFKLLHAERNALRLGIEADHLHLHRLADLQRLGRDG